MNLLKLFTIATVAALSACGSDEVTTEVSSLSEAECPTDSTLTYDSFGKEFMDTYCNSCHGGDKTGTDRMAAPKDDVFDTLMQVEGKADELYNEVVFEEAMPFGEASEKPSAEARKKFGEWLACGAP